MSESEYPEVGDLVISTVRRVVNYGAYVSLDEYGGKEGLIHTSELSTTWVKNVRDYAREGQKLVCKVLRVNPKRNQVDLSLRRVSGREKKEKLLQWKMDKRADSILRSANEKMALTPEQLEGLKSLILKRFDSVYEALEESLFDGSNVFKRIGIPPDQAEALTEAAASKIRLERARVRGTVELTSFQPRGVDDIKESLSRAAKVKRPKRSEVRIYALGAPRYRIEVTANEYAQAEEILEKTIQTALDSIRDLKGEGRKLV
ncbi:MAG: translation initiation factor IF-2 subunit alpha [Candidatus Bathyarchaeia archaeon]